jgi:hypothetical protein
MKASTLPLIQSATHASLESGREELELPMSAVVVMIRDGVDAIDPGT